MDLVEICGLQDVRGFDDPFAAARGNENAEHRGIDRDQQWIGVVGADGSEDLGQGFCDSGSYDHSEDYCVERELDEHAAGGWNALRYRAHETLGTPVQ